MKILISTYPFATTGKKPLEILENSGHELIHNPFKRRLKTGDINDLIENVDAIIAGTEPYPNDALKNAKKLKVISRVGIGLDNLDLNFCKKNGIQVSYTPDAPSRAVQELTISFIINILRHINVSDQSIRNLTWNRFMGKLVSEVKIGILGVGRIGSGVIKLLEPFQPNISAYDINPEKLKNLPRYVNIEKFDSMLKTCDLISLHIPMNRKNHHLINKDTLNKMKQGSFIVNTARGGLIDDQALYESLKSGHIQGAALDVFETEPYEGPMCNLSNVVMSAHIGASANYSRYHMELGAAQDCIRFLTHGSVKNDAFNEIDNS
jgi:D-3-phosphoglycerate dehydrogenase